ncbi:MAG TPA: sensor domain-containing diguanylate cyclase [Thermoanaerobaculia bacterium]|nr:sensor domain-containing diguanylate cyclase [Thermoanaerobaculia bacterium]
MIPWTPADVAILTEIARIATADLELRPMLQRITDALADRLGWEFVGLVRIDEDASRFTCEAMTTDLPTAVHVGYSRELGSGIVGEVAATGCPLVLDDVRRHGNYVETLPGTLSEICVPVKHRGRVVALLGAESPRLAAFHGQLPLAQAIAEQIAGAIASARLYEEIKRRACYLEILSEVSHTALQASELKPLLGRIAEYVQARFDLAVAAIVVESDDGLEWEHRAFATRTPLAQPPPSPWPVQAGVVGRAIRTGQPQLVLDVRNDPDFLSLFESVAAEYVLPIRFRDHLLGAMNLESDTAAVFSSENLTVLGMIADQVAGAIHLAALNQRLSAAHREIEEANRRLQEANAALQTLSLHDPLTGLANRRLLDQALDREWRHALETGGPLSLLLVDIDNFKSYNDLYGHLSGDASLRAVADILAALWDTRDLVGRYGGEEFLVLLPDLQHEGALVQAELLRRSIEALRIPHQGSSAGWLTVSVGTATRLPDEGSPFETLVAAADSALYRAKTAGRNQVR